MQLDRACLLPEQLAGTHLPTSSPVEFLWNQAKSMQPQLWTIGHSNRTFEKLTEILFAHRIEVVADVRRFGGSRRNPQFNVDVLSQGLCDAGIGFRHFPTLGGRRTSRLEPSPNTGWRVPAFKAYADYMHTVEFAKAFRELKDLASQQRTAIMCAEVLPWRCHRRLLADLFVVQGWEVFDIMDVREARKHELPPFAQVMGTVLTYPGGNR